MTRTLLLLVAAALPVFSQSAADTMLARLGTVQWGRQAGVNCATHSLAQIEIYGTDQWTHHCSDVRGGIVRETFFYVFGEPARTSAMRVDLRPQDESPQFTAALMDDLRRKLTARFGAPDHAPELMEIGFRRVRYGQPVAGDHWKGGGLHYFLHSNQTNPTPMGMRRGAQLIVLQDALLAERRRDEFIGQVDGLGGYPRTDDPVRTRLEAAVGAPYRLAFEPSSTREQSAILARRISSELTILLREAELSGREGKALRLLAADALVAKLSVVLDDAAAGAIRRTLARYNVKLGGQTHNGGLAYRNDLVWRVWREFPETDGGEMAFRQLQNRGWNTDPTEGCPANPDLFRTVIEKGEAFLEERPQSRLRLQVLFTVAAAYESWWSIAHARADDPFVSAPPYPRKAENRKQAGVARERAIRNYREVVRIAPQSPEAASALRRLPRLELSIDTGQRRFFRSYC